VLPQPTTPVAAAEAPTAPYAATEPARPELPIVSALTKLRGHDGEHELTIQLHPAELGAVSLRATVHEGAISVSLHCAEPAAQAAVTASLSNLHNELQSGGFTGVNVSVGSGQQHAAQQQAGSTGGHHSGHRNGAGGGADNSGNDRPVADRARTPRPDRGLDRWL
jgi:flagellar hook-length control protein FliK